MAHIHEHPEMQGMENTVAETLSEPELVIRSLSDEQARLYYRSYSDTPVGAKLLCVVVKMVDTDAFVVTAYLTDRLKRGEILWSAEQ